jgi:hypothetical protein
MSDSDTGRPTFGEKAVGLDFNPSGNADVENLKKLAAAFIDACQALKEPASPAVQRMFSLAITDAQTAQMWAVKGATWRHD